MSRELLSRAWSTGAGPGPGPLTIDLDSTICETYGLAKEGARHHGDVLMARLREGRANTARGAGHFLREEESVRRWPIGFCRMLSVWGRLAIPDTLYIGRDLPTSRKRWRRCWASGMIRDSNPQNSGE